MGASIISFENAEMLFFFCARKNGFSSNSLRSASVFNDLAPRRMMMAVQMNVSGGVTGYDDLSDPTLLAKDRENSRVGDSMFLFDLPLKPDADSYRIRPDDFTRGLNDFAAFGNSKPHRYGLSNDKRLLGFNEHAAFADILDHILIRLVAGSILDGNDPRLSRVLSRPFILPRIQLFNEPYLTFQRHVQYQIDQSGCDIDFIQNVFRRFQFLVHCRAL